MGTAAKPTRQNRTITIDFRNESTSFCLRRKSPAPHRSRGSVMAEKNASTDYPIHEPLAARWSPYAFENQLVPEADLRSLFEAARWAPSSYNEQPWSYIVATKDDPEQFQRLLSCLSE